MSEQKLTVPDVLPALEDYAYRNPGGGCLHIYLEDGNWETSHIRFCEQYAREHGDKEAERLAGMLLRMTGTQRRELRKRI